MTNGATSPLSAPAAEPAYEQGKVLSQTLGLVYLDQLPEPAISIVSPARGEDSSLQFQSVATIHTS
jgi:hypothetical protein